MKIRDRNSKKPVLAGKYLSTGILLVLVLAAVVGCSRNPLQTEPQAQAQIQPEFEEMALSAASRGGGQGNDSQCHEASGLVTVADGGEIQLGWGGPKNSLQFDPGAVAEDVYVDVKTCVVKGTAKNHFSEIVLEFGPENLSFDPPGKIVINVGSLNSLKSPKNGDGFVRLYYYDPDADEWLLQQEAKIEKGKVTFSIEHFSKFGISHRRNRN